MDKKGNWDRGKDISLLETYDIVTGERKLLKEFDCLIEAPNWSRDGKYLVYNSGGKIFRYWLETGAVEQVETGFAINCNNDHLLSFDGKQLAVSHSEEKMASRIYLLPIDGGTPKEVTPNAPSYLHGWSPDGNTLAYCAFREGKRGDIYTVFACGGEEVRLTFGEGHNDGPEYSPNGKDIWFNSTRSGLMQLWRMKTDGSEQTQMTFDEDLNSWFPHLSPDGKQVVFLSYHKEDLKPEEHLPHKNVLLRLMPASGGIPRTLLSLFGGQGTINVNSWSPDGGKFAFVSYRRP